MKRTEKDHLYHIVTVRLSNPYFTLRATKPGEKGKTTSSFARLVKAVVAVNGDWLTPGTNEPRGLAVGDGDHWPGTKDDKDHSFIACEANRRCEINQPQTTKKPSKSWKNVVGGDGSLLIRNSKPRSAEEDSACGRKCTGDRPRTAVGLNRAKTVLFLLVAEGARRGVKGPTLRQVALALHRLGAHTAMSFEGGPSSTMVINGKRVNELPAGQGRERVVSNHFSVVYHPPEDGCSLAKRLDCYRYGCACVAGNCSGGFCLGDGCTKEKRSSCDNLGCSCVDMQCKGGLCPGTGCTAKMLIDCKKRGCHCVDGKCAGGKCEGRGCTARRIKDCAKYGCRCVSGDCLGGFCPGTGCTVKQVSECVKYGCACVDGKCSGGHCPGNGCTARQVKSCLAKGCSCVDGKCAGGKCPGSGCTIRQVRDCSAKRCSCARGLCTGGRCAETGCAGTSCSCGLRREPTKASATLWLTGLLVAMIFYRRRFRAFRRRRDLSSPGN